jgi:hypothetical protein
MALPTKSISVHTIREERASILWLDMKDVGPMWDFTNMMGLERLFTSKRELSRVLVDFRGGGSQMLEFVTKLELGSGSFMLQDGVLDSMSPNKRYLLSMLSQAFQKHEVLLRPATAWIRRHVRTTASTLDLTCRRRRIWSNS